VGINRANSMFQAAKGTASSLGGPWATNNRARVEISARFFCSRSVATQL